MMDSTEVSQHFGQKPGKVKGTISVATLNFRRVHDRNSGINLLGCTMLYLLSVNSLFDNSKKTSCFLPVL